MTDPVRMRADQLSVGDLVPDAYLPHRFNKGPAEVRFVADDGEGHTFFAFRYPNGQHDSTTVLSVSALEIWPGETTQPIAGRQPPHVGAMTEGGLVDETPKPHPSWPTEAELKPWETLAPQADRLAESMESCTVEHRPGSVDRARHYLGLEESAKHNDGGQSRPPIRSDETIGRPEDVGSKRQVGIAECGCPVRLAPEIRGDAADTIVEHDDAVCAERPF
jgi:hypothetical protein